MIRHLKAQHQSSLNKTPHPISDTDQIQEEATKERNRQNLVKFLYGKRDKLSVLNNRHIAESEACAACTKKCPKYIDDFTKINQDEDDGGNMFKIGLDIANNNNSNDIMVNGGGHDWIDFDNDDSESEELEQLWFDPWEGQIELSGMSIDQDILEDDQERVLTPLEKRRKSLLRQTSLPVFNQPIYSPTPSLSKIRNDFRDSHKLFWNPISSEDEETSLSDVSAI